MRAEKTVRDMRDKLLSLATLSSDKEYIRFLNITIDALDWVLGE